MATRNLEEVVDGGYIPLAPLSMSVMNYKVFGAKSANLVLCFAFSLS